MIYTGQREPQHSYIKVPYSHLDSASLELFTATTQDTRERHFFLENQVSGFDYLGASLLSGFTSSHNEGSLSSRPLVLCVIRTHVMSRHCPSHWCQCWNLSPVANFSCTSVTEVNIYILPFFF